MFPDGLIITEKPQSESCNYCNIYENATLMFRVPSGNATIFGLAV